MRDFINNGIVQGVLAALILAFLFWVKSIIRRLKDENKIIRFLKKSAFETELNFRSTHAISSATNLTEERVNKVCGKSKRIRRNQKEKKSWILNEKKK